MWFVEIEQLKDVRSSSICNFTGLLASLLKGRWSVEMIVERSLSILDTNYVFTSKTCRFTGLPLSNHYIMRGRVNKYRSCIDQTYYDLSIFGRPFNKLFNQPFNRPVKTLLPQIPRIPQIPHLITSNHEYLDSTLFIEHLTKCMQQKIKWKTMVTSSTSTVITSPLNLSFFFPFFSAFFLTLSRSSFWEVVQ